MSLIRLIYCSRFSEKIDARQLRDILSVSRVNNPARQITGVLCYGPGVFLQCLEGPREAVNALYGKIVGDPRNKEVTLLEYDDIAERVFGEWSMAYVRAEDLSGGAAGFFGQPDRFDPYAFSAGAALLFVRSLLGEKERFT